MCVGEYITLYQLQRGMLRQRAQEKDEQVARLAQDKEALRGQLTRLNCLVQQLVGSASPLNTTSNLGNSLAVFVFLAKSSLLSHRRSIILCLIAFTSSSSLSDIYLLSWIIQVHNTNKVCYLVHIINTWSCLSQWTFLLNGGLIEYPLDIFPHRQYQITVLDFKAILTNNLKTHL